MTKAPTRARRAMTAATKKKPVKASAPAAAVTPMTLAQATDLAFTELSKAIDLIASARSAAEAGLFMERTLRVAEEMAVDVMGWMDHGQHERHEWSDRMFDCQSLLMCAAAYREAPASALAAEQAASALDRATDVLDQRFAENVDTDVALTMASTVQAPGAWQADAVATAQKLEAVAPLANAVADAVAAVKLDARPDTLMGQVVAVFQSAAENDGGTGSIWALRNLATFCAERASDAMEDSRPRAYDEASAAIASMLDLMGILKPEEAGGTLFWAAQSLLQLAKTEVDAQWQTLAAPRNACESAL